MLAARMTAARPHRLLLRVALLAATVLLLGLPQVLVLCVHHGGDASLEWAHPEGTCCHHDATGNGPVAGEGGATDETPGIAPGGGCEHDSLAIDLAPPPQPDAATAAPLHFAFAIAPFVTPSPTERATMRRPPPTGPPRTDARTELRATSLLLL